VTIWGKPNSLRVVRRRLKRGREASAEIKWGILGQSKLIAARVLPPGAAQASRIVSPGWGLTAKTGRREEGLRE